MVFSATPAARSCAEVTHPDCLAASSATRTFDVYRSFCPVYVESSSDTPRACQFASVSARIDTLSAHLPEAQAQLAELDVVDGRWCAGQRVGAGGRLGE